MDTTTHVVPVMNFVLATEFILIFIATIVAGLFLKRRLDHHGVHVYAQVTHTWDPPSTAPIGLSESIYRVFAKWTDPQTQQTYYFAKSSTHPLNYHEGDIVPATINLEHPCFRCLNI